MTHWTKGEEREAKAGLDDSLWEPPKCILWGNLAGPPGAGPDL
jgi:hypothetical protein